MYLIVDPRGRCLLERRPPMGLWGGLWIPPERAVDEDIDGLLEQAGVAPTSVTERRMLDGFRHSFTHFHLDIEPVRIDVSHMEPLVTNGDRWRWYDVGENEPLGLSAVAVRLVALVRQIPVIT
jgi:A/G-specific adenine glycosylase